MNIQMEKKGDRWPAFWKYVSRVLRRQRYIYSSKSFHEEKQRKRIEGERWVYNQAGPAIGVTKSVASLPGGL